MIEFLHDFLHLICGVALIIAGVGWAVYWYATSTVVSSDYLNPTLMALFGLIPVIGGVALLTH